MRLTTLVLQARLPRLALPRGPLTACRTRWRSTRAVSSSQASHQTPPVHFSDLPLDRAGHLRSQPERLDELLRSPSTQLLPFHRGKALVGPASLLSAEAPAQQVYLQLGKGSSSTGSSNGSESGNGVAAGTVTLQLAPCSFATPGAQATAEGQPPKWVPLVLQPGNAMAPAVAALEHGIVDSTGYLFLGLSREGHAVFAFELAAAPVVSGSGGAPVAAAVPAEGQGEAGAAASCQWADVRAAGQGMAGEDAAVLALATGLARWHSSAAFCSRTGAPLAAVKGGHGRAPASAASSSSGRVRSVYPRVDPAVIVAAVCGDWLLLGRKKSWDAGRYSLLAGFCEVGETLEQAAVREVQEESGVELELGSLSYHSSQPWPFPSSLMIGFVGRPRQQQHFGPPSHLLSDAGRAAAHDVRVTEAEIQEHLLPLLPEVKVAEEELEDARWFHRSFLLAALQPPAGTAQGTAQGTAPQQQQQQAPGLRHCDPRYYPKFNAEGAGGTGAPFRIPGRYALANRIIWGWLQQQQAASQGIQGNPHALQPAAGAAGTGAPGSVGTAPAAVGGGAENGAGSAGSAALGPWLGELLPEVSIDEGSFKYVLLRVSSGGSRESPACRSRVIVRGDARAGYHDHIWKAAAREVRALEEAAFANAAAAAAGGAAVEGERQQQQQPKEWQQPHGQEEQQQRLQVETLGGGRIEHYPEQRLLSVFGYSSAFGQAPHELTAALLKKWFPMHEVVVSYDGY